MKLTKLFVFWAGLLVGLAAWSQDFPRAEVAADYSYARFYPVARGTQSLSLNGGGGALVVNVTPYFGIKMDLQGYGSNTVTWTNPAGGSATAQGNLFTYLFGPQIKLRSPRFQPFGHFLLGGAHSNVYANLTKACQLPCTTSASCRECFCPGDRRRHRYSDRPRIPVPPRGNRLPDDALH